MHKKNVLVTGATGFIGRHLIGNLINAGLKIIVVANSGFESLREYSDKIQIVPVDIRKPIGRKFKASYAVHLAGIVGERNCMLNIETTVNVNILGTLNIINSLNAAELKKFIFISTANVYASANKMPVDEDGVVCGSGIYNLTKLAGELLVSGYCNARKLPFNILRVSQIYGPYQPKNTVVSDVIEQLLRSNILRMENPNVISDFIYITDVVNAILILLESKQSGIINVGSGMGTSVGKIIKIVSKLIPERKRIQMLYNKDAALNTKRFWLDNSKLKSLRWRKKVALEEGLKQTIKHMRLKIHG
jgi:nucleoside-diphosphate-sugar epimerase